MAIAVILIPRLSKEEDQPNAVDTMSEMGIMSSPLTDDNVDEQERQLRLALVSKICDEDAEGFIPHEVCWDGNQDNDQLLGLALADQEIVGVLFFGACSPLESVTCEVDYINLEDEHVYVRTRLPYNETMNRFALLDTAMRNNHHDYNIFTKTFTGETRLALAQWAEMSRGLMSPRLAKRSLRQAWENVPSELREGALQPSLETLLSTWNEHNLTY